VIDGDWTRVRNVALGKLWLRFGDLFVCAPPKCGGSALHCLVTGVEPEYGNHIWAEARKRGTRYYTPEEVATSGLRSVMAVRHPAGRFMSLWRNKCRDGDSRLPAMKGMTPDELMDVIEKFPVGNSHWAPQMLYWHPGAEVVDYRDLGAHIGLPALTVNKTTRGKHPKMPVRRILNHYRLDMELWKQTQSP
jgi:hypothetical protein